MDGNRAGRGPQVAVPIPVGQSSAGPYTLVRPAVTALPGPHRPPAGREPDGAPTRVIRVLIAESLALYGGALVALLAGEPDLGVIGSVRTDGDVIAAATRTRADVAVLDVDAPSRDGFALARRLHEHAPGCRILVLTGAVSPGTLRRALDAHAHGLVDKNSPPVWLAESIRRVASGERVVDPNLAIAALESGADHALTHRELEVLRRAAQGESVREIASRLCLSDGTVRNYLSKIIGKLGARNRIDAIRIVRDSGWL